MEKSTSELELPGFRFHPTEEELLDFYLKGALHGKKLSSNVIGTLNLYRHDPWELPGTTYLLLLLLLPRLLLLFSFLNLQFLSHVWVTITHLFFFLFFFFGLVSIPFYAEDEYWWRLHFFYFIVFVVRWVIQFLFSREMCLFIAIVMTYRREEKETSLYIGNQFHFPWKLFCGDIYGPGRPSLVTKLENSLLKLNSSCSNKLRRRESTGRLETRH